MRTIKVHQGQTFFDVVIETTGDITNAFDMANLNNSSVTNEIQVEDAILIVGKAKQKIVQSFSNGHYPATASQTRINNSNEYGLPLIFPMI